MGEQWHSQLQLFSGVKKLPYSIQEEEAAEL